MPLPDIGPGGRTRVAASSVSSGLLWINSIVILGLTLGLVDIKALKIIEFLSGSELMFK